MTPEAAAGGSGFLHELVLHTSTEEMLAFLVAFAQDGVDASEPTLLAVRPETAATVCDNVGPSPNLAVLPVVGQPGRPASDLRATDTLLASRGSPVRRVRVANQEPTVPASHWPEWRRLEAVVNIALTHHQAWAVCVYDRDALTDAQIDDLYRTHPLIRSGSKDLPNDRFQDPAQFIAAHRDTPPDPVEQTVPTVELTDPSPAAARATVTDFTRQTALPVTEAEGLILATSEAVANAIVHGQPPIVLRIWPQPTALTVTVTDTGPGPTDPFVGLLPPARPNGGGMGLWISHQLTDVTHRRHAGGYTIRMVATRHT